MKSLQKVIKNKSKFMSEIPDPLYVIQTFSTSNEYLNHGANYKLYKSKNNIVSKDELTLFKEISPLMVYISSCEEYNRGKITVQLI